MGDTEFEVGLVQCPSVLQKVTSGKGTDMRRKHKKDEEAQGKLGAQGR